MLQNMIFYGQRVMSRIQVKGKKTKIDNSHL